MKLLRLHLAILCLVICACSTEQHVSDEYGEMIKDIKGSHTNRTVLFILVDGLPIQTISSELNNGHLPHINDFFIGNKKYFNVARTGFPSMTFPSIASLITESPVDKNGIYGNQILINNEKINFQTPEKFEVLNKMISNQNIFSRLKAKGLKTVSLDYTFNSNSLVHTQPKDVEAGLAVLKKDYAFVDNKLINSLEELLTQTEPSNWPDFIFLHIVGLDFTSHDQGPQSKAAVDYLSMIDSKMGRVFEIIKNTEEKKKRSVVSFLSTDHGFDISVSKVLNLEESIEHLDSKISFLNEGRFAALTFPAHWTLERKQGLINGMTAHPDMDIVAFREGDKVYIHSQKNEATIVYLNNTQCTQSAFQIAVLQSKPNTATSALANAANPWTCPDSLDTSTNNLYYPFFISNLSHYFQANPHPDVVMIPKPGVAFHNKDVGQHGGPTPQETIIPLLIHNGTLSHPENIPPVWELLKFM